jgi:ATP-binding cassette subfamily B protein
MFEQGRIVEQGSHEALLARPGGFYRRLHRMQAAGLVAEPGEAA